MNSFQDSNVH